jgi:anti-sigma factor ChrR (cupin superfamily)
MGSEVAPGEAIYHHLASLPWENPKNAPAHLQELAAKAAGTGARRAPIPCDAINLYSQISELPAGYEIPPHTHGAHELMVVLAGSAQVMNGPELLAGDITEIPAGTEYGFVAGDDGIRFLVVRPEASVTTVS